MPRGTYLPIGGRVAMRTFFAPGRANLIGEHTDYTDGLVMPVAIDRGITLHAELGGSRIRLDSESADATVDVPADGTSTPSEGWGRFVSAVAYELTEAGRPPVGIRGRLTSTLPQGAGLSSSAALEVVVAIALCAAADLEFAPIDLAALCRRAEHRAVGVPSGIMDQAASLLGREEHALLLDCGDLNHRHVPLPETHVLLIIDSGVRRELEAAGYSERAQQLQRALKLSGAQRPKDLTLDQVDSHKHRLGDAQVRRLRHAITENRRVLATEEALTNGNLEAVGRLFYESHVSLRDDFEVSTPELDTLVELGLEEGAVAARMTGGGFGGCVIMLAASETAEALAGRVTDRYRSAFPSRSPACFICRVVDGARELAAA